MVVVIEDITDQAPAPEAPEEQPAQPEASEAANNASAQAQESEDWVKVEAKDAVSPKAGDEGGLESLGNEAEEVDPEVFAVRSSFFTYSIGYIITDFKYCCIFLYLQLLFLCADNALSSTTVNAGSVGHCRRPQIRRQHAFCRGKHGRSYCKYSVLLLSIKIFLDQIRIC